MIIINTLFINELSDGITVKVTTEVGNTFTKVLLWNSETYKDPGLAIDVSDLLDGTSEVEDFIIPASSLNVTNITGLWFLEFTTDEVVEETDCCQDNVRIGVVANFIKYQECILNKALNIDITGCDEKLKGNCEDCGTNFLYVSTLFDSLLYAVGHGLYDEAIKLIEVLDEMCEVCNTCPDYGETRLSSGGGYGVFDNILRLL